MAVCNFLVLFVSRNKWGLPEPKHGDNIRRTNKNCNITQSVWSSSTYRQSWFRKVAQIKVKIDGIDQILHVLPSKVTDCWYKAHKKIILSVFLQRGSSETKPAKFGSYFSIKLCGYFRPGYQGLRTLNSAGNKQIRKEWTISFKMVPRTTCHLGGCSQRAKLRVWPLD